MTSQVAPCDVSSVYGIRRAMGIAVPLETSESFTDLTTGEQLTVNIFVCVSWRNICYFWLFISVQEMTETMEALPS